MEVFMVKRITARKLINAQEILENYNKENSSVSFYIPSLMRYCIENEVRSLMKNNKMEDSQIDEIFDALNFNVNIMQDRKDNHQVRIEVKYDKIK
jgi:hypothetical protein